MKLFYSLSSPYSRKVRMVLRLKRLEEQVEEVLINPFTETDRINKINPLGKIPVLELDNGECLYDSPVICYYLNQQSKHKPLLPEISWSYWANLRWGALADGLTDAAYNLVMERRRLKSEQSNDNMTRWHQEISSALTEIENKIVQLDPSITLAHLSIASALGYLEFRLSDLCSLSDYPKTLAWYVDFKTQQIMLATQHH